MSLFGVGILELILVLMIALVVAGPKRLLHWAYLSGRFIAQMRTMWGKVVEAMQNEFDESGVDFKLPKDPTNRQEMQRFRQDVLRPLREPIHQAMRDYEEEQRAIKGEIQASAQPATPAQAYTPPQDTAKNATDTPQSPPSKNGRTDYGTWSSNGNNNGA